MKYILLLILCCVPACAQNPVLTLNEASGNYTSSAAGLNISQCNYFTDLNCKNLITINPALQGRIAGLLEHAASGTATSFTSDNSGDALAANAAVGWGMRVQCHGGNGTANGGDCTGGASGCTATITSNTASSGGNGPTFNWSGACAAAVAVHDTVIITTPAVNATTGTLAWLGPGGWNTSGTVAIDTTPGDLPPAVGGFNAGQCFKLTATPGSPASITQFFDSTSVQNYQFTGGYHMAVQYKVLSGSPSITMSVSRSGGVNYSGTTGSLTTGSWATATQTFTASENTTTPGTVTITYGLASSSGTVSACLALTTLTADSDTNPTIFRNQVVTDFLYMQPATLRFNNQGVFQGETLDNWLNPYKQIVSTSPYSYTDLNPIDISPFDMFALGEYLQTQNAKVATKIDIPVSNYWTTAQYQNFVDFVNGGGGTTYGAKRIALGHAAGYTLTFNLIKISIGNEAWNSSFSTSENYYSVSSNSYWNYIAPAIAACTAMKAQASWDSTHMKCGLTVQTATPFFAGLIQAQDTGHVIDYIDANEYGMFNVTSCTSPTPWVSSSDEAYDNVNNPSSASGFAQTVAVGYPVQVYEGANSTNSGSCTQAQINGYPEGQGYTPTTILTPALANKVAGVTEWSQWQLTQPSTGLSTSGGATSINEWGVKTGMGASVNAYRGTAQAFALYNPCAALGTAYSTSISNLPTHNSPAQNGLGAQTNVPNLYAFAYKNGANRCVLVVNASNSTSYTYTLTGTNPPTGSTTRTLNTAASLTANNEGANITPTNFNTATTVSNPAGGDTIPAHSAITYVYTTGAPAVTCSIAANSPTYGVNFLPGSSRHITFTYPSGCPSGTVTTADHAGTTLTLHGTFTNFYTSSNSLIQFTGCNSPFDRWLNGATLPIISTSSTQVQVQFTNPNTFTGSSNTCTLTEIPKVTFTQATTTGTVTATLTPNSAGLPDVLVTTSSVNGNCTATGSAPSVTLSSTQAMTVTATSMEDGSKTATYSILQCGKTTTVDIPGNTHRQAFLNQLVYLTANVMGDANKQVTWSTTCGMLDFTNKRNTVYHSSSTQTCTVTATSVSDGTKTASLSIYSNGAIPSYASAPPNKAEIQPCDATDPYFATVRQVGPTKANTTINAAITQTLPSNPIIQIYNEDTGTTPTTYAEWWMQTGTAYVCGVPNALGYLPVVDGDHAKGPTWVTNSAWYGNGIASINHNVTCNGLYAGGTCGPTGNTISNIKFVHANSGYQFYLPDGVTLANWGDSAGVSVRTGQHTSVIGNSCDTDAICVASYSIANGNWASATQGLDDSGNYCVNYGTNGSSADHCHYIQSLSVNVSKNLLGAVISGDQGSGIKNRSIGWQMAFNRIENGPARGYDGVEVQDWSQYVDLTQYYSSGGPYSLGDTFGADGVVGLEEALYEDNIFGNVFNVAGDEHNIGDHVQGTVPNAFWGMNSRYSHHSNWFYNSFYNPGVMIDESTQQQVNWYMLNEHYLQNNILYDNAAGASGGFSTNTNSMFIAHMQTNLFFTGSVVNTTPIYGGQNTAGEAFGWSNGYNDGWGIGARPLDPHLFTTTSTAADYLFTASTPFNTTTFVPSGAALGAATSLTGVLSQFAIPFNAVNLAGVATTRTTFVDIGALQSSASISSNTTITGGTKITSGATIR